MMSVVEPEVSRRASGPLLAMLAVALFSHSTFLPLSGVFPRGRQLARLWLPIGDNRDDRVRVLRAPLTPIYCVPISEML